MATDLRPALGGRDAAETRRRLLDAAERLFAERGFMGTSIRAVTQAAGVSVSAANYHFGSKEALLAATYGRAIIPLNEARLARLTELERSAGDAALPLTDVLDTFLRPIFESPDDASFRGLAGRLFSDPPEIVTALKQEYFGEISERFVAALVRALPDRDVDEVKLAFQFVVGVMVHVIAGQIETNPTPPSSDVTETEELLAQMIRFAAAGLQA
ncbi:MAG: TetR/AcrR family transcriptional regulator [Myxococcota bacterium]|nr:TetR/AcrR family transcriptional regulator [Myxococcota bacterium]